MKLKKISALLVISVVWTCVAVGGGIVLQAHLPQSSASLPVVSTWLAEQAASRDASIPATVFERVYDELQSEYLRRPAVANDLFYGAIKGMVAALDDPYSSFLPPEDAQYFNEQIDGSFGGIGAEIGVREKRIVIVAPLADTPAARAGLQPGDMLLAIDDEDTTDMALDLAVKRIRGEKGTPVKLIIYRDGMSLPEEKEIVREKIDVPALVFTRDEEVAILSIRQFSASLPEQFVEVEKDLLLNPARGIVLDLRNNPGGYLDVGIGVLGSFLPQGTSAVIEDFGDDQKKTYVTKGSGALAGIPLVVIQNGGSASASEIVAGALRDHGAATVIGEQSFGKGTVQSFTRFGDGSSLKLTVASWLTPNGHAIDGEGVSPDIEVSYDFTTEVDEVLAAALEKLRTP